MALHIATGSGLIAIKRDCRYDRDCRNLGISKLAVGIIFWPHHFEEVIKESERRSDSKLQWFCQPS
jgi:hypothetical protein